MLKKVSKEYQEKFSEEILNSEKKRAILVSILLVLIFTSIILNRLIFLWKEPESLKKFMDGANLILLALALSLTYELLIVIIFKRFKELKRNPPHILRYVNAFVESSTPSIILYIFAIRISVIDSFFSPPTYAYLLFILLSILRLDFKLCFFTGLVCFIEYNLLLGYFYWNNLIPKVDFVFGTPIGLFFKSVLYLVAGAFAGIVSIMVRDSFLTTIKITEERKQIMDLFGQHVSPSVVDTLLQNEATMESETKEVCIMFLDIRGFTSFSENKSPVEVIQYLNELFSFMIEIVIRNNGIINKFLGDGFMAVFGAPIQTGTECIDAVNASIEILEGVKKYNFENPKYTTKIGIGLHSGTVFTGNVGSDIRKEYTVIGDVVNLASRIEQMNKTYSSQMLVSEDVIKKIEVSKYQLEEVGNVNIRGRENPVKLYKFV